MSSNSRQSGSRSQSALTDAEAFERCHPEVRRALCDSVFEWSAAGALRYQRRHGTAATIEWLRGGDQAAINKGWWRGVKSPCISCRVKPLYSS